MPISEQELEQEAFNKRIHFWNRMFRVTLVMLVLAAIGIQLLANAQSKKSTLEARKSNIARQQDLQDYFKCLAVLKFDVPPEQLQSREGVIKALDSCAQKG